MGSYINSYIIFVKTFYRVHFWRAKFQFPFLFFSTGINNMYEFILIKTIVNIQIIAHAKNK